MRMLKFSGGDASFQSDQWSFCAALYEAMYGERPFADRAFLHLPPGGEIARRPGPADVRARWLWEVLERGLSPRPEERFPSMEELLVVTPRWDATTTATAGEWSPRVLRCSS